MGLSRRLLPLLDEAAVDLFLESASEWNQAYSTAPCNSSRVARILRISAATSAEHVVQVVGRLVLGCHSSMRLRRSKAASSSFLHTAFAHLFDGLPRDAHLLHDLHIVERRTVLSLVGLQQDLCMASTVGGRSSGLDQLRQFVPFIRFQADNIELLHYHPSQHDCDVLRAMLACLHIKLTGLGVCRSHGRWCRVRAVHR